MVALGYSDFELYRRLLLQARPYRLHIVGIFLLSLLSTPLALLAPLPVKIAVDNVIGSDPLPGFLAPLLPVPHSDSAVLVLAVGLLVTVALLGQLQGLASTLLHAYTSERLGLEFQAKLFRHTQRLPFSYHDARGTSDATYRILYDTYAVDQIAINGIIPFITAIVTLVSMLYITSRIDWQLAIVALGILPILLLLARIYRRRIREHSRRVKTLESAALWVVQEVLAALRVVKAFGQEDREQERFVDYSSQGMWARIRLSFADGGLGFLFGLTSAVGMAAILFIGVRHVQAGLLTLGELLLVIGYVSQLHGPLEAISGKMAKLQTHFASAERAYALLDEAPDVVEQPNAKPLPRAAGAIAFRNVSFAYQEGRPVLRDISFEIPAGTRVGITGRTGAGKSTLVNLLPRFFDPTEGKILLDGVDLRGYKLADLRNQFAFVLQEPVLFSTSIAENIAYGRPGASESEIVRAAMAANAHDFIMCLPAGYHTLVGERGMRFSGGERQRIALARAFLKDAPILVLDEPTSSVDMRTETGIIEAMECLMRHRTTFMIAHRLSTLESCDVLLVIESGDLVAMTSDVSVAVRNAMASGGLEASITEESSSRPDVF